ncbi:hypothetical protein AB0953_25210 [Streptomyces sp. NPDC046866]|uniref:hypothetical protein n=1 Tax=Streptomyces sp. NPDC046866 TaxID=3154921 RepID=UPI003455286A
MVGRGKVTLLGALTDQPRPQKVVVDLHPLSFRDSSGLNSLLDARNLALEHHQQDLTPAAPGKQVLRPLERAGALRLCRQPPSARCLYRDRGRGCGGRPGS